MSAKKREGRAHFGRHERIHVPHVGPSGEQVAAAESCGEEIVVPLDVSAESHQHYVEDCPVRCNPMALHLDIDPE